MKHKKGAIEGLQALIVPLIVIALVLVVGFLIFSEAKKKIVDLTGVDITATNESVTWTNNTWTALTYSTNCMTLGCTVVYNGSNGSVEAAIASTLYECGIHGIKITIDDVAVANVSAAANVTYTCKQTSRAFNGTSTVQNATQDIPGWLPIIIITVIGALLIGLISRFRKS